MPCSVVVTCLVLWCGRGLETLGIKGPIVGNEAGGQADGAGHGGGDHVAHGVDDEAKAAAVAAPADTAPSPAAAASCDYDAFDDDGGAPGDGYDVLDDDDGVGGAGAGARAGAGAGAGAGGVGPEDIPDSYDTFDIVTDDGPSETPRQYVTRSCCASGWRLNRSGGHRERRLASSGYSVHVDDAAAPVSGYDLPEFDGEEPDTAMWSCGYEVPGG